MSIEDLPKFAKFVKTKKQKIKGFKILVCCNNNKRFMYLSADQEEGGLLAVVRDFRYPLKRENK